MGKFPDAAKILDGLFAVKGNTRHTVCDCFAREVCDSGAAASIGWTRPWFELSRDLVTRVSERMQERIVAAAEVPGALATLKHLHAQGVVSFATHTVALALTNHAAAHVYQLCYSR